MIDAVQPQTPPPIRLTPSPTGDIEPCLNRDYPNFLSGLHDESTMIRVDMGAKFTKMCSIFASRARYRDTRQTW